MFGGFVMWHRGEKADGTDSFSEVVKPLDYWPTLRVLIAVVSITKEPGLPREPEEMYRSPKITGGWRQ